MVRGAPGLRRPPYSKGEGDDRVQTAFRLPWGLHHELEKRAHAKGQTLQLYILEALTQWVVESEEAVVGEIQVVPPAFDRDVAELKVMERGRITLPELATGLGTTAKTAQNWSHEETFPKAIGKRGKARVYDVFEVKEWVERWREGGS